MTEQERKEKYNKLSIEEMKEYIEKKAPQDKAWFKEACIGKREIKDNEGNIKKTIEVYSHLKAKRAFCERYMPELVPPKAPKKVKKTDFLKDW